MIKVAAEAPAPARFRGLREIFAPILSSKKGFAGLALVLFYVILGIIGPLITKYDPITGSGLADNLAMPEWYASIVDPKTPRNVELNFSSWKVVGESKIGNVFVNISYEGGNLVIKFMGLGAANVSIESDQPFLYSYKPAKSMLVTYSLNVSTIDNKTAWYDIKMYIVNLDLLGSNKTIRQGDIVVNVPMGYYAFYDETGFKIVSLYGYSKEMKAVSSQSIRLPYYIYNSKQEYKLPDFVNPVDELLLAENTRIAIRINASYYCNPNDFIMRCDSQGLQITIPPIYVKIYGLAFGVLGTNYLGNDVWTQFIYGSRSAIIFGFGVASAIVLIGLLVGVLAGYHGGKRVDHALTFLTDVVFFLPALPLILAVGITFGRSIYAIFAIIVLLSWPGTARIVRSWSLALRNEPYVEAAQALGSSTRRIIAKHIIPHLTPLIVYAIVLDVPSAIFTEVAIQLLGFGDPGFPSWGKMLNEAWFGGAITSGAWWWILPPVAGVTTIALGFALLGLALDEIVNPRLRRRV
ncbi:MAG: ABC transporter permease [Desulfurococcales archaeon]|nr:ABC transporter permease [Desulfurococcales archaeon]